MRFKIRNGFRSYRTTDGSKPVLSGIDLEIDSGEFVCVLGPSGCGKSTLLRACAGLDHLDSGTLFIDDEPAVSPGPDRFLILQDQNQVFPWMTARQNVELGRSARRLGSDGSTVERATSDDYLRLVDLYDAADYYPHQLSGGMRQRLALARALAVEPRLLLMDEPFASLDAVARGELQSLLLRVWRDRRMTILFVTHDIGEALLLGDRVLLMDRIGGFSMEERLSLPRPRDLYDTGMRDLRDRLLTGMNRELP